MPIKETLEEAQRTGQIVRIEHSIDGGYVDGFVVATGRECFVLEIFDETVRLNGFSCLRYSDVNESKCPAPYHAFLEKILRLRGLQRGTSPPVDLTTLADAIRSAQTPDLFVSLHVKHDDGDTDDEAEDLSNVCYIGKILAVENGSVTMHCIDPGAIWEEDPDLYDLDIIYRMDFGGGYEEALQLASKLQGGSKSPG